MLSNPFFNYQAIRKYTTVFGSMFNDIVVQRNDRDGNNVQTIPVPLAYASKWKILSRIRQDPNLDRAAAIQLPRMSFEIVNFDYDPTRKLNTTRRERQSTNTRQQYLPVPYNIDYQLSIISKTAEDGAQIIEQILPFFTPDWTVSMNLVEDMDIVKDIPFTLISVVPDQDTEGQFDERNVYIWNLNFIVSAYIFGPIKPSKVIKKAIITSTIGDTPTSRYTVRPGLTANGTPTTIAGNSIDYLIIDEEDDFGFVENIDNDLEE